MRGKVRKQGEEVVSLPGTHGYQYLHLIAAVFGGLQVCPKTARKEGIMAPCGRHWVK